MVSWLVKGMLKKRVHVEAARVLVMGITYKKNYPDLRNTRVIDIVKELAEYNIEVDVYDPWVSAAEAPHEYGIESIDQPKPARYDGVILAVGHSKFKEMGATGIRAMAKPVGVIYDLKYILSSNESYIRL